MAVPYLVKRGTAAQIAAAAAANGLREGQVYLCTDTLRLRVGLSPSTWSEFALVGDVAALTTRTYAAIGDFLADAMIPSTVTRVRVAGQFLVDIDYVPGTAGDYDVQGADGRFWRVYGMLVDIRAANLAGGNTPADGPKIQKLAARLPVGGALLIPEGRWYNPGLIHRDDITVQGVAVPQRAADDRSYQGGSIILGRFQLAGNRTVAKDFGVDAGADFLGSSAATDAFVFAHPTNRTLGTILSGCRVDNVVGLCKNSTEAHGVLIEGHDDVDVGYVRGDLGLFGSVLKAFNSRARHLDGYHSGTACSIVKSDWYAPHYNTTVDVMSGVGLNTTTGVCVVHAKSASMNRVGIGLVNAAGGQRGLLLIGSPRPVNPAAPKQYSEGPPEVNGEFPYCALSDLTIKSFICVDPQMRAFDTSGALIKVRIDNMSIDSVVTSTLVVTDTATFGIDFGHIYASGPSFNAQAVLLQGLYTVESIVCVVTNNRALKNGITFNPGTLAACSVGKLFGTTSFDSGTNRLTNGWTSTYAAAPIKVRYENNRLHFHGYILPPSGGANASGTNKAFYLPIMPPTNEQWMTATAGFANGTVGPVRIRVMVGGGMAVEEYQTGQAAGTLTYMYFDGASYMVE